MNTKDADRALDDTVDQLNHAYAEASDMPPGVVVDYVLVYAVRRFADDGQPITVHGLVFPADSRTSHYAGLGLVTYAAEKIRRQMFDPEDHDD